MNVSRWSAGWAGVLAAVTDRAHFAAGDELCNIVDDAVAAVGLRAEVLVVTLAQRALVAVRPDWAEPLDVEGTLAGRAFQHGEPVASVDDDGGRLLWMPMLDGTERVGVMRLGLGGDVVDDHEFRAYCWSLTGLSATSSWPSSRTATGCGGYAAAAS